MTGTAVPQGTVASYDLATRAGSVLLDDGQALTFAGAALCSGVRLLRVGQRVRFELRDSEVVRLTLLTLPCSCADR